ncbi:aminoglycoside phosphotransferase family protein [Pseudonocardia sp.]|uniref:phosphotransferase enzyme family protein n=1 Tax=Pseudonocardia sp. TaxID=60912 RepID=UPI0026155A30|nr:aminoglycoside phosphotransferase family protein [Pseudonocardia sp.]
MRPAQEDRLAGLFTASATRSILTAACRDVGLDGTDAVLLRHGENAVYRLVHHPVVARIARHADVPRREVVVAAWLADCGFSAVRLYDGPEQLLVIDGRVVTWWDLIVESPEGPTFADLASVLRRLHDLPPPTAVSLPTFDPMPRVLGRLTAAGASVTESDRDFLAGRQAELRDAYKSLSFELEPGPIHGDAHLGNLMRRKDGTVVLIDLEAFAWGPREWDASVFAAAYAVFGWMGEAEYRRCVDRYGWDPLTWSGFPTMRAIRELNMTSWLMQRAGESAVVDDEIARRLADLRNDELPRRWRQL